MKSIILINLVFLLQVICAFFFISDILASVFGFSVRPLAWETRELMEIGAAFGLAIGVLLGGIMLYRAVRSRNIAEAKVRRAATAFHDLLEERFAEWALTPAECDVALFAIKGMSTAEIAVMRVTSEGTVKAQTNAIYRKAGVSGRPQLLAVFIEDLMSDSLHPRRAVQAA